MNKLYDYVIIGAGIAGLTYAFRNKSNNFIILEKNDYIGGRIKNIKWNNTFISLGGGVFLPTHKNILNLCENFGINIDKYTSIYHLTDLKGDSPNNPLYYKDFEIIYKALIKKYSENKDYIKQQKLTFKEFLILYFPYSVYETIINNSLYSTNFDADPGLFLENEYLFDCLKIKDTEMMYIKEKSDNATGYDFIINKMLESISMENIKLNSTVLEINQNNDLYEIILNNDKITTKKIILATDINSKIKFNLKNEINSLLDNIYNNIGYEPYIRIYSYHKDGHNLKNTCKTRGLIGKTIIMDKNVLMLCYNESNYAIELNNLLKKLNKNEQIDNLYKLFLNHNIEITKPDDIYIQFWEVGMHYPKPNIDIQSDLEKLKNVGIEIIGEIVAKFHGWVESALSTIN